MFVVGSRDCLRHATACTVRIGWSVAVGILFPCGRDSWANGDGGGARPPPAHACTCPARSALCGKTPPFRGVGDVACQREPRPPTKDTVSVRNAGGDSRYEMRAALCTTSHSPHICILRTYVGTQRIV